MKTLLLFIFALISSSLYAQDNDKWFQLEGVSNPQYKIYLDETTLDYAPGVTIIVDLKYEYTSDSLLNYSINRVKFLVSKDEYEILSTANYCFPDKNGKKTEQLTKSINPIAIHLIPGSEMSVIYQGVYIQAVTIGPTKK